MSEVRPALTAELWAAMETEGAVDSTGRRSDVFFIDNDGRPWFECDGAARPVPAKDLPGIAALALRGQPFGFTWADVEWLRGAADFQFDRPNAEHARDLADRIAALLPPRP